MSDSPSTLPISPPSTDGKSCMTCGYALDGLRADGVCPECGTEVELSLRPDRLVFASPQWLKRVHRGFVMLEVALAFHVATSMFGGAISYLGLSATPLLSFFWIIWIVGVIFSLIELWGWWLVSTLEPARAGPNSQSVQLRRWLRPLALTHTAMRVLSGIVFAIGSAPAWGNTTSIVSSSLFAILVLVATRFVENFAVRAPLPSLLRTIRLANALGWLILVRALISVAGAIAFQYGFSGAIPASTCVGIPLWFGWLAWAINYARAIDGLRNMFARIVERADQLIARQSRGSGTPPSIPPDLEARHP